jgi:hypothetical protein
MKKRCQHRFFIWLFDELREALLRAAADPGEMPSSVAIACQPYRFPAPR